MARQSMFKRLSERSTCFLELVLCFLVTRRIQTSLCSSARDSLPFRRVILEDSTTLPMSPGNHAEYPAGGGSGRSAGAKLRLMIDLLGSAVLEISRHTGATPDQALCDDALTVCAEGDLLVRDMGFFRMGSLKRLSDKGVRWLTRLPASTSARTSDGTTLLELLTRPGAQEIDCEIVIGGSSSGAEPLRARLVARRLPQEIAERHRRERRKKSKGQGKTASKESMERAGWTIMVTDVTASEVAVADLFSIYSQRWTVEIVFRAIKGAARAEMALGRRRRKDHQDALILATAILAVLGIAEYADRRIKTPENAIRQPSVEKVCRLLGHYLLKLTGPADHWPAFDPDPRQVTTRRRKRVTLCDKATSFLR